MTSKINATPPRLFTQQSKPSRSLNTVYQNATGKPILVSITVTVTANTTPDAIVSTDGSNPPTTEVTRISNNSAFSYNNVESFIVLPGNFYKVSTAGTVTIEAWTEWT